MKDWIEDLYDILRVYRAKIGDRILLSDLIISWKVRTGQSTELLKQCIFDAHSRGILEYILDDVAPAILVIALIPKAPQKQSGKKKLSKLFTTIRDKVRTLHDKENPPRHPD